jgi:hypothetical protein
MKTKAKTALECDEKAALYARRKVEVESVFGHIKGNRSFRKFSLRGIDKVHVEFGIVAMAHNILKVAGIRQLLSNQARRYQKTGGEKRNVFLHLFYFRDLSDSPFSLALYDYAFRLRLTMEKITHPTPIIAPMNRI